MRIRVSAGAAAALVIAIPLAALGFIRATAQTGACLYWLGRDVPWHLSIDGNGAATPDVPFESALTAVQKSFHTWEAQSCADIKFRYQGTTQRIDTGYDPAATNNLNLVVFRRTLCGKSVPSTADGKPNPCFAAGTCGDQFNCWSHDSKVIALTTTHFDARTGVTKAASIELNDTGSHDGNDFTFSTADGPKCLEGQTGKCVKWDIQNTLTHEAGHFLGLDHVPNDADAVMFPTSEFGEVKKRALSEDDIAGLCTLYPKGEATNLCPANAPPVSAVPASTGCQCGSGSPAAALLLPLLAAARRRRFHRQKL